MGRRRSLAAALQLLRRAVVQWPQAAPVWRTMRSFMKADRVSITPTRAPTMTNNNNSYQNNNSEEQVILNVTG